MTTDRVGYFKGFRLGDLIHGPEDITVSGEDPQVKAPLQGASATIADRGCSASFELEVAADLIRSYSGTETTAAFEVRRLRLMAAIKKARGYGPTGTSFALTTAGILSVINDATNVRATTGGLTAGSTVAIAYSGSAYSPAPAAGDLYLIGDTDGVHEIVVANGTVLGASFTVATLVNDYDAGAVVAPVAWYLPGCFMLAGTNIPGNDEGQWDGCRDIRFKFLGFDNAVNSSGVLSPA